MPLVVNSNALQRRSDSRTMNKKSDADQDGQRVASEADRQGKSTLAEHASSSEQEEQQHLLSMFVEDTRKFQNVQHVAISSCTAFYLLLATPMVMWLVALTWGIAAFKGLPADKRSVQHLMLWFDLAVFRKPAGPLLPFISLFIRSTVYWLLSPKHNNHKQQPSTSDANSRTAGSTFLETLHRAGNAIGSTLAVHTALLYTLIVAVRIIIYVVHLAVQGARGDDTGHGSYLSDHILLGASVMACLQVELICAASDVVRLLKTSLATPQAAPSAEDLLAATLSFFCDLLMGCAALCPVLLMLLVSVDMHFTARYYHERLESGVAVAAGAALFQVPASIWIWTFWRQGSVIAARREQ